MEFQFKLLHGAIYTKKHLLKFGFTADNLCSFCKQEAETHLHLFWDCVKVKARWQEIIYEFELLEARDISWKEIHVGLTGNSFRIQCRNSIMFMIKQQELFRQLLKYKKSYGI